MIAQLQLSIRDEIAAHGPMTFARFMELALYHPQWGYYTAPDAAQRIGRGGDYYTSVSVGALFGELLARQFAEIWEAMGRPAEFTLLELGAHRGQLATDVLGWIERERSDFAAALRCETRDWPGELPASVAGGIFSNELVDALPVHRIVRHNGEWLEQCVIVSEDGFTFTAAPLSSEDLRDAITRLPLPGVDGYTTEVQLEASRWMRRVACALKRGFVLTIDYGHAAEDYYAPHRKDGTLLCYHQHQVSHDPLARVGEQDITAHVNFTALADEGAANGLQMLGYTDQSRFVTGLLEQAGEPLLAKLGAKATAQLKTLLHPELMGRTFKVLVQHRGMEGVQLSGLKFACNRV
ncbi:MAG: SAM-dependent methyltransferase [Verrucomicrobia bacterium]|nr:SAM-dependent methyltransferase [Verrucomicrobiota bacterium]